MVPSTRHSSPPSPPPSPPQSPTPLEALPRVPASRAPTPVHYLICAALLYAWQRITLVRVSVLVLTLVLAAVCEVATGATTAPAAPDARSETESSVGTDTSTDSDVHTTTSTSVSTTNTNMTTTPNTRSHTPSPQPTTMAEPPKPANRAARRRRSKALNGIPNGHDYGHDYGHDHGHDHGDNAADHHCLALRPQYTMCECCGEIKAIAAGNRQLAARLNRRKKMFRELPPTTAPTTRPIASHTPQTATNGTADASQAVKPDALPKSKPTTETKRAAAKALLDGLPEYTRIILDMQCPSELIANALACTQMAPRPRLPYLIASAEVTGDITLRFPDVRNWTLDEIKEDVATTFAALDDMQREVVSFLFCWCVAAIIGRTKREGEQAFQSIPPDERAAVWYAGINVALEAATVEAMEGMVTSGILFGIRPPPEDIDDVYPRPEYMRTKMTTAEMYADYKRRTAGIHPPAAESTQVHVPVLAPASVPGSTQPRVPLKAPIDAPAPSYKGKEKEHPTYSAKIINRIDAVSDLLEDFRRLERERKQAHKERKGKKGYKVPRGMPRRVEARRGESSAAGARSFA